MDDPTNAHAVPGPSSHPASLSPAATLPPATVVSAGALALALSSAPVPRAPGAPVIVPTLTGADGIKEVPALFELCEAEDLITLIASMLDRLISHNDRIPLTPTSLTRFHSRAPPSINVRDYLLRIARYTNVESVCLLILLHYVDKVCTRMPTFTISSLTVHRFIIAAVSVGSKALSDSFCTNGRYARVGGVSIAEMNLLEKEFCEAIDWRLTTTGSVLAHYYTSLVRSHPAYRLPPTPTSSPLPSSTPLSSSSLSLSLSSDAEMYSPATTSPDLPADEPRGRSRPSPALIPAWIPSTRSVTASNLPSPARGAPVVDRSAPTAPPDLLGLALARHSLSSPVLPKSPPLAAGSPGKSIRKGAESPSGARRKAVRTSEMGWDGREVVGGAGAIAVGGMGGGQAPD